MNAIIIFIITITLATTIQGLTGFGFSLLATPILLFFLPSKLIIPLINILSLIINLILVFTYREHITFTRISRLSIGGITGISIGITLFDYLNMSILTLIAAVLTLIFSLLLLKNYQIKLNEKAGLFPIGFLSGLLGGIISFSGLPLILFFSNQKLVKNSFKATLSAFFLIINSLALIIYLYKGIFTEELNNYLLVGLPFIIIFTTIGIFYSKKLGQDKFRKATLFFTIFISCLLLYNVIFS